MLPTKEQNPDGLHQRYNVTKASGEPVDPNAFYFVLRLDSGGDDQKHIHACRAAAWRYAKEIKDHIPGLSRDIEGRLRESLKGVLCPGLKIQRFDLITQTWQVAEIVTADWGAETVAVKDNYGATVVEDYLAVIFDDKEYKPL